MKLKRETLEKMEGSGWHVLMVHQPPYLFPDDGRKLRRCATPSDPWLAIVQNHPCPLTAEHSRSGAGPSPDEAVLAAIPEQRKDVRNALAALETAFEGLITVYQ